MRSEKLCSDTEPHKGVPYLFRRPNYAWLRDHCVTDTHYAWWGPAHFSMTQPEIPRTLTLLGSGGGPITLFVKSPSHDGPVFNSNRVTPIPQWGFGRSAENRVVVILIARWLCWCWVQINTGLPVKGNYQMECFLHFSNWSVVLWHCSRQPNTFQTEKRWVETSSLTHSVLVQHKPKGRLVHREGWDHTGRKEKTHNNS